jgi:hypothetical protein
MNSPFLRRSHKERHFRFRHPACIGKKRPLLIHTVTFRVPPVQAEIEQELHVRRKKKKDARTRIRAVFTEVIVFSTSVRTRRRNGLTNESNAIRLRRDSTAVRRRRQHRRTRRRERNESLLRISPLKRRSCLSGR